MVDNQKLPHLAVDDATGTVVGAFFDVQETLYGYYMVLKQILKKYGILNEFFTDNRTVFHINPFLILLMSMIRIHNLPMLVSL